MRLFKSALLALTAIVVSGVGVVYMGNAQAQTGTPVWGLVSSVVPPSAELYGVYMQDKNTAWIVGAYGYPSVPPGYVYKIEWHAGQWALDATYTFRAPLHAIVAISDDNVWAVGDEKLIVHKDASGWHEIDALGGFAEKTNLTAIQMFSNGEEGWAAGTTLPDTTETRGFLVHLVGGKIQKVITVGADQSEIDSLHFADGEGWAVGGNSIWRYTKDKSGSRSWRFEGHPACPPGGYGGCGQSLLAVRAINSEEAWVVGYRGYLNTAPSPIGQVIFHRVNGQWQQVTGNYWPGWGNSLHDLSFSSDGVGFAVGSYVTDLGGTQYPYIISPKEDGKWHFQYIPSLPNSELHAVSQFDSAHALAVGYPSLILSYGYGPGAEVPTPTTQPVPTTLPSQPVKDPQNPQMTYFPSVGHTLAGAFRDYWNAQGGLAQFGYPITEGFIEPSPTDGKQYIVQYFERARFELHPENKPPYDVLLGLLGRTVTQGREKEAPFLPAPAQANPGSVYFQATQHNMAPEFAPYWQEHGGLSVYGYPIAKRSPKRA